MLKNYFKIAIAVLKRRKFFTFISLFGISFTLMILIVVTAFIDHIVSPSYPDTRRNRSLYVNLVEMTNKEHNIYSKSRLSLYFLNNYVKKMKTPEKVSIISSSNTTNTYVGNRKLSLGVKHTNMEFWEVNEFDFTEGRPFNQQELANADHVAVISESTKNDYFGKEATATGKYIETDNVQYRVTGVVKDASASFEFVSANVYLPYTIAKTDLTNKDLQGGYSAVILAKSKDDIPLIQQEYQDIIAKKPLAPKQYEYVYSHADSYFTAYTRRAFGDGDNSGLTFVVTAMALIAFLFMLLPALNLININISRIMERSSEIGVRKAFGASSATLVYQFIIENIILTAIGCFIGIIIAWGILAIINNSGWLPGLHLTVNLVVLTIALLICLVFGLITGVYPAWRMAKLHVVAALKAQ